ncbi:hypothetical protein SAMN04488513_105169 [Pseudozobellia thermophila]|uniref:Uncharacterized protein n=1 Tax=Pseudozobellia thermophila TaxID=192903 RepID=A0A1M6JVI8_9FLAO|nr:hypothetical protein SAMN04488513_105169 [Pseudozobellia thermophila]
MPASCLKATGGAHFRLYGFVSFCKSKKMRWLGAPEPLWPMDRSQGAGIGNTGYCTQFYRKHSFLVLYLFDLLDF